MRNERERFKVRLQVRILAKIADAGYLDVDRHETTAGGKQSRIQIRRAVHPLQSAGKFAAAILKQMNPTNVCRLTGATGPADEHPLPTQASADFRQSRGRGAVHAGIVEMISLH